MHNPYALSCFLHLIHLYCVALETPWFGCSPRPNVGLPSSSTIMPLGPGEQRTGASIGGAGIFRGVLCPHYSGYFAC